MTRSGGSWYVVSHTGTAIVISLFVFIQVSGSTVGLGDFHPSHPGTRVFCIFFLPFLVAVLGELLARIAGAYMERKQDANEKAFMSRSLATSDLAVMDTNQDGRVEKSEFLAYMLIALNKVEKEDLDEINELFDRLDKDQNGSLTKDDVVQTSLEHALRTSRRTLGLREEEEP